MEKSGGGIGTLYWYMTPGIVAESDLAGNLKSEYVFFNGERVARRDFDPSTGTPTGVFYYFSDHLKTASVITDSSGNITADSDYYPWGGELQLVNNDSNHYKFTGKERDSETGLDYFGARYYSNGLGRFITPDWAARATAVPYAEFSDPQSLNLYSYVRNIPTTQFDADGHFQQCGTCEAPIQAPPPTQAPPPPVPEPPTVAPLSPPNVPPISITALLAGAAVVFVPAMLFPESVSAGDKDANGHNVDDPPATQSEPATSSGGARKGGGGKHHGNTRGTQHAERYKKYDKNGKFLKHGVSQNASTRYSKKQLDGGRVDVVNSGPRHQMLDQERHEVETNPGPDNHEPWSGRQQQPAQQQPPL